MRPSRFRFIRDEVLEALAVIALMSAIGGFGYALYLAQLQGAIG